MSKLAKRIEALDEATIPDDPPTYSVIKRYPDSREEEFVALRSCPGANWKGHVTFVIEYIENWREAEAG